MLTPQLLPILSRLVVQVLGRIDSLLQGIDVIAGRSEGRDGRAHAGSNSHRARISCGMPQKLLLTVLICNPRASEGWGR